MYEADLVFSGWWTREDGNGTRIERLTSDLDGHTLYAFWNKRYNVTFLVSSDPEETNGHRYETLSVMHPDWDGYVTAPERYDIERHFRDKDFSEYVFRGWYTSVTGGRKVANPGGLYQPESNRGSYIDLYARWEYVGKKEEDKATVSGIIVSGTTGMNLPEVSAEISLTDVTVSDPSRITNLDVTDWFDNFIMDFTEGMPTYLSLADLGIRVLATASNDGKNITLSFSGTPKFVYSEAFSITVPATYLSTHTALDVEFNASARFNFLPIPMR